MTQACQEGADTDSACWGTMDHVMATPQTPHEVTISDCDIPPLTQLRLSVSSDLDGAGLSEMLAVNVQPMFCLCPRVDASLSSGQWFK